MDVNVSDGTYVTNLKVKDKSIYVKLYWKPNPNDLFQIQIFDGYLTFSGRFSNEFAKQFRQMINIAESEEEYSENVKKCLMGEDCNYTYDFTAVEDNGDTAAFSWKKRFKGVGVLHGKVPVHRDQQPESKDCLIDTLLNQNKDLKNTIGNLSKNTDSLNDNLDKCRNDLEKLVSIKSSLESSMYGKFVQVLNAKKRRIQLLEENLQNIEAGNVSLGTE